jgi:AraC family transcriptional regulator, arabinose operon regulatory protein
MHNYGGSAIEDDVYTGHKNLTVPYFINCCGYIKIGDIDVSLKRTRIDCYIIYLVNGTGHYKIGQETIAANSGSIIIYTPSQDQDYYYKAHEKTELYWIHFTGAEAEKLLTRLGFINDIIYQVGIHTECIALFENIIHELQIHKPYFQDICISYLLQLLALFSRSLNFSHSGKELFKDKYMENVIKAMNLEFQQEHQIEHYAEISNLSIFQFIRNFKKATGLAPAKYIERIRIAKAKELLCDSNLSVTEISYIIGYKDPFYFSKVFKRSTGLTPSVFRNNSLNI